MHSDQFHFWQQSFGKRPEVELYNIKTDPACMENLAEDNAQEKLKATMREQLFAELRADGDPRMLGKGHIFDEYPYAHAKQAGFYERYMAGEKLKAGWVNESDFEKGPLE